MEKLRNMDRKILAMLIFVIVVIIVLVLAMVILSMSSSSKMSYTNVEKTLVKAAKKYYKDNPSLLPTESGKDVEVDDTTLASGGYMKDLSTYTKSDKCVGTVYVGKNKDDYDYVAYLDCGDKYKTALLYKKIIEKKVESGNGLYAVEDFIESDYNLDTDDDGYDLASNELLRGYVFRGDNVDNYISLDGVLYRIIKIDGNNDFMVTPISYERQSYFDNRYNSETDSRDGFNDYSISVIYEYGQKYYRDKIKDDTIIKTKAVSKNVCVGARNIEDTVNDGTIECSKVLKDTYVSLIPVYDILNASLSEECLSTGDKNCGNYNYLLKGSSYWTLTPNDEDNYQVMIVSGRRIKVSSAKESYNYRYVYFLSNKLIYDGGTGTKKDPYRVK